MLSEAKHLCIFQETNAGIRRCTQKDIPLRSNVAWA